MASEALGPLPPQSEAFWTPELLLLPGNLGVCRARLGSQLRTPDADPRPRQTPWEDAGDCTEYVCVDTNYKPQWTG